jgi:hypothetical protein
MATARKFRCPSCGRELAKSPPLFKALLRLARRQAPQCENCQTALQLHLDFDFAMGARHKQAIVLASFLPRSLPEWNDGKVCFYPFLVILKRVGAGQAVWLPYWHVEQDGAKPRRKYGQWAPVMETALFTDLLEQAQEAGLFPDLGGRGVSGQCNAMN